MPNLHQTLRTTDLDFLQRIALAWKIDLQSQSFPDALKEIETSMPEKTALQETLEFLPADALEAWNYLVRHQGRESWAAFTRQFGELRAFGLARREREKPDQNPASAVEVLWYRSLIGRAFLNISKEPQEYAFIPDEFLEIIQAETAHVAVPLPRPASAAETKITNPANDSILDDATELLAALRMERPLEMTHLPQRPAYRQFLDALLSASGLITPDHLPEPEKVKTFLSASRGEALLILYQTWEHSRALNDLKMLPGVICDGVWANDPLIPRELVKNILRQIEPTVWWSINSLLAQVRSQLPDFQRPAGDYDSWFIRDEKTGEPLRGFEHWNDVEGALLRYLIGGPLFWLGVVDIARSSKNSPPQAFKISDFGLRLLQGQPPLIKNNESGTLTVTSDGMLLAYSWVPRALKYQLARFCEPILTPKNDRKYRITAQSLRLAGEQGLHPTQLLQLLQQAKVKNIPQSIVESLERWQQYGAELVVESVLLLRLDKPDLMPILQRTPKVSKCLGDILNNKTAVIKPGHLEPLVQALAEIGLLTEVKFSKDR